jgi:serine/threonine protein kinase
MASKRFIAETQDTVHEEIVKSCGAKTVDEEYISRTAHRITGLYDTCSTPGGYLKCSNEESGVVLKKYIGSGTGGAVFLGEIHPGKFDYRRIWVNFHAFELWTENFLKKGRRGGFGELNNSYRRKALYRAGQLSRRRIKEEASDFLKRLGLLAHGRCAVKLGFDPTYYNKRAKRENLMRGIYHPNLIYIAQSGHSTGKRPYLILDYVPDTIADPVAGLSVEQKIEAIQQVLDGLMFLSNFKIVHRDIKIDNILFSLRNGNVFAKIIDFNVMSLQDDEGLIDELRDELTFWTKTGEAVVGTPDSMSPEQARDSKKVDILSDLFSAGATLYQLLTGETANPAPRDTIELKLMNAMNRTWLPLLPSRACEEVLETELRRRNLIRRYFEGRRKREMMKRLDPVLAGCIQKRPEDRYQEIHHLREDLDDVLQRRKPGHIMAQVRQRRVRLNDYVRGSFSRKNPFHVPKKRRKSSIIPVLALFTLLGVSAFHAYRERALWRRCWYRNAPVVFRAVSRLYTSFLGQRPWNSKQA